ncbi:MAG: HNH endonuclease signature motif containing protein [Caldilineaceae bacterium]
MSSSAIPNAMRAIVKERAGHRCEYCHISDTASFFSHEVDHIVATKHGGRTEVANLAYACWRCNRHKGTDLASLDPTTEEISLLFHPRLHVWSEHFGLDGVYIIGLTSIGRATLALLQINRPDRIQERQRLQTRGLYASR